MCVRPLRFTCPRRRPASQAVEKTFYWGLHEDAEPACSSGSSSSRPRFLRAFQCDLSEATWDPDLWNLLTALGGCGLHPRHATEVSDVESTVRVLRRREATATSAGNTTASPPTPEEGPIVAAGEEDARCSGGILQQQGCSGVEPAPAAPAVATPEPVGDACHQKKRKSEGEPPPEAQRGGHRIIRLTGCPTRGGGGGAPPAAAASKGAASSCVVAGGGVALPAPAPPPAQTKKAPAPPPAAPVAAAGASTAPRSCNSGAVPAGGGSGGGLKDLLQKQEQVSQERLLQEFTVRVEFEPISFFSSFSHSSC